MYFAKTSLKTTAVATALAITAVIGWSAEAETHKRPPVWQPAAGETGTAQVRAWNYYCTNDAGDRARMVVDSYRAPQLADPNAAYAYQYPAGAHPLTEQFRENRVLVECRNQIGGNVHIIGVDEVEVDWRREK